MQWFLLDVSPKHCNLHSLFTAGCAAADRRRFDHKPAQIYWFGQCTFQNGMVYGCLSSGVSCLEVALRSESQKCLYLGAGAPLGLADKDSNMCKVECGT